MGIHSVDCMARLETAGGDMCRPVVRESAQQRYDLHSGMNGFRMESEGSYTLWPWTLATARSSEVGIGERSLPGGYAACDP